MEKLLVTVDYQKDFVEELNLVKLQALREACISSANNFILTVDRHRNPLN